jgi:hypothetical protein
MRHAERLIFATSLRQLKNPGTLVSCMAANGPVQAGFHGILTVAVESTLDVRG